MPRKKDEYPRKGTLDDLLKPRKMPLWNIPKKQAASLLREQEPDHP
jgi:hypothetical protein